MKFHVYKDGQLFNEFSLEGAYIFGPDRTPLRSSGNLDCKQGVIDWDSASIDAAGMALMWPVHGAGNLLLSTTRLRNRTEPYNLNLELARARLMQITIKREDWAFFDDQKNLAHKVQEAMDLFVEAIKLSSDPAKASVIADECLSKAVLVSEKLAQKYAESFLAARKKKNNFGRYTLGCNVQPGSIHDVKYCKRLFDMFGFATIPVSWAKIEQRKGEFDFSSLDKCVEVLASRKMYLSAGPLLRFSQDHIPAWLMEFQNDFSAIQDAAYNFVFTVVKRYAKQIHSWRIISGINAYNLFEFNLEQSLEITRTAAIASRTASANSKKVIDIVMPWGEYYAENQSTIPPLVYVDMVVQSGVAFDAIGVQLNFGAARHGYHLRDMMQISARLDCFAAIPKPLFITSLSVPSDADSQAAGYWKEPWSEDSQAKCMEMLYKIALGKPFVSNVTYAELADDPANVIKSSGLIAADFEPKKAYKTVGKLQKFLLSKDA